MRSAPTTRTRIRCASSPAPRATSAGAMLDGSIRRKRWRRVDQPRGATRRSRDRPDRSKVVDGLGAHERRAARSRRRGPCSSHFLHGQRRRLERHRRLSLSRRRAVPGVPADDERTAHLRRDRCRRLIVRDASGAAQHCRCRSTPMLSMPLRPALRSTTFGDGRRPKTRLSPRCAARSAVIERYRSAREGRRSRSPPS